MKKSKMLKNLRVGDILTLYDSTRYPTRIVKARVINVFPIGPSRENKPRYRASLEIVKVNPPGFTSWQTRPSIEGIWSDRFDVVQVVHCPSIGGKS